METAMTVRAKFYVSEITRNAYQPDAAQIKMQAVTRGEDNKAWAAATPVGSLQMSILNGAAAEQFELGAEYFIDFTPAPKGQEGMDSPSD
jgi:hypothetical protein